MSSGNYGFSHFGGQSDPLVLKQWITAERVAPGKTAIIGYNTTLNGLEYYDGAAWQNIAITNTAGQGYVRTSPLASSDNLVSASTTTIDLLTLKTTDDNTAKVVLRVLASDGTTTRASVGATGLAVFAGINSTPIGPTTPNTVAATTATATSLALNGATLPSIATFINSPFTTTDALASSMFNTNGIRNKGVVVQGAISTFNITTKALTTNVATLTTSATHNFIVGDSVVVAGVDATFNGAFTITAKTGTTFSYAKTATDVVSQAATGTGSVSQTATLLEVQSSSGNTLASFGPNGGLAFRTNSLSGLTGLSAGSTIGVDVSNNFVLTSTGAGHINLTPSSHIINLIGATALVFFSSSSALIETVSASFTPFTFTNVSSGGGFTAIFKASGTNQLSNDIFQVQLNNANVVDSFSNIGALTVAPQDTATAAITNALTTTHGLTTANAGVAGIGTDWIMKLADSTSAIGAGNQVMRIRSTLPVATHASRTGLSIWSTSDNGGERDVIGIGANGSAGLLGFYPTIAAAPIAQPASTSEIDLVLSNLGLRAAGTPALSLLGKYNADTLAGNGLASVVGSVSLTGQTASITATNIFNPPANGMYEAQIYLEDTTASTSGGTVLASVIYTDDNGSQAQSTATIVLSVAGFTSNVFTFFAKTSAQIQYSTTVGGVIVGSPQYALRIVVVRLT